MSDETAGFVNIVLSLVYTIILYGAGPLAFAILRKNPVTIGKVRGFSILYSFSAWFCSNMFWALYAGDAVSSGGAALLWSWIFYKLLKNHLYKTYRLTSSVSAIPDSRYKAQEAKMRTFVVDGETGEVIHEEPAKPKPSNTNSARDPAGRTSPTLPSEPPVVQPATPLEPDAPKNRRYKVAVISLSAVCAILAVSVFLVGYSANSTRVECLNLEATVSELESKNEAANKRVSDLAKELDSISEELDQANDQLEEVMEPYQFLSDNIGFIVSGSRYYHTRYCSIYQRARSYQAHNIDYCISLGYSRCPDCWDSISGRLVDSKTGDPIVMKSSWGGKWPGELTIEDHFEWAHAEAQENDRMNVDAG